jgi:hypothetical protein
MEALRVSITRLPNNQVGRSAQRRAFGAVSAQAQPVRAIAQYPIDVRV